MDEIFATTTSDNSRDDFEEFITDTAKNIDKLLHNIRYHWLQSQRYRWKVTNDAVSLPDKNHNFF